MNPSLTQRILRTVIKHFKDRKFITHEVAKMFPGESRSTIYRLLLRLHKRGVLAKEYTAFYLPEPYDNNPNRVYNSCSFVNMLRKEMNASGEFTEFNIYFNNTDWHPQYDEEGNIAGIIIERDRIIKESK